MQWALLPVPVITVHDFRSLTWISYSGIATNYEGEIDFDPHWRPHHAELRRPGVTPPFTLTAAREAESDSWQTQIFVGGGTAHGHLALQTAEDGASMHLSGQLAPRDIEVESAISAFNRRSPIFLTRKPNTFLFWNEVRPQYRLTKGQRVSRIRSNTYCRKTFMLNDARTHGLWEASAPPGPTPQHLEERISVDVVVVGAGYTGLSAALHLAEGGASVAVLEAVEIGFGGSGRNVGLVNAGMWVMPEALPGALGQLHGSRLLALLGSGPSLVYDIVERQGIDCEPVRNGTLHCAVGASGQRNITERARQWKALGAPVTLLDADETAKRTGTHAYRGALLDMRAGTIQPLAYARGLARAAVASGARVYTNSPVAAVEDVGTHWRLRTAGGGTVHAKWVVVATNAYTGPNGVWSELSTELVRLPYFNMATACLSAKLREAILPGLQGAWDTRDVLSSFRLDKAGRLVFGSVGALRGVGLPIHQSWGRRALAKLFPALKGIPFEYEWYGWIGMTTNALPRYHRLARNTISFSGYNGRGIATGTVFGRELAKLALGHIQEADLPLPLSPVAPVSIRPVREAFYEVGAQVAHLSAARF